MYTKPTFTSKTALADYDYFVTANAGRVQVKAGFWFNPDVDGQAINTRIKNIYKKMIEDKIHYKTLLQKQERSFTLTTPIKKEITTQAFTRALKKHNTLSLIDQEYYSTRLSPTKNKTLKLSKLTCSHTSDILNKNVPCKIFLHN